MLREIQKLFLHLVFAPHHCQSNSGWWQNWAKSAAQTLVCIQRLVSFAKIFPIHNRVILAETVNIFLILHNISDMKPAVKTEPLYLSDWTLFQLYQDKTEISLSEVTIRRKVIYLIDSSRLGVSGSSAQYIVCLLHPFNSDTLNQEKYFLKRKNNGNNLREELDQ